jgi:mono/diheme cytochrome c family protein
MRRRLGWLLGWLLLLLSCVLSAADKPKTVWDGVYAASQADRGQMAYTRSCARCHGEDLTGSGNVLRGKKWMDHWREDNLRSFFNTVKTTMPRGAPKSLADAEYVDIIAYVLRANEFPAGAAELTADTLEGVQVMAKEGPQPVPDFSLVTVVGCLYEEPVGTWRMKDASEPVRTRNPRESTPEEDAAAAAKAPGAGGFRLLDTRNFPKETVAGRWVEAKGFLIRTPADDKLNLTWLRMVGEMCRNGK